MKRILFLIFNFGVGLSFANRQVAYVVARPTVVNIGVATNVMIEATMASDPDLLRSSVNLIRVSSDGRAQGVEAVLVDDGTNGDRVPNDGVYTCTLVINNPIAEKRKYIISAAYRGVIGRVTSVPITISIDRPSYSSPPDLQHIVTDDFGTYPAGELLVRFVEGTPLSSIEALVGQLGASIVGFLPIVNTYQLRIPSAQNAGMMQTLALAEANHSVLSALPNYLVPLSVSNDLSALRASKPSLVDAYSKIQVFDAWNNIFDVWQLLKPFLVFSPVAIGIVDGGVDHSHQEFHGVDFGHSPPSQTITTELINHGTSVSGIIGANNLSAFGTPGSEQMNGIVSGITSNNNQSGSAIPYVLEVRQSLSAAALIDMLHSQNQAAVKVVNMSFNFYRRNAIPVQLWSEPAITNHAINHDKDFNFMTQLFGDVFDASPGTLFVVSAGNYPFDVANSCPSNLSFKSNVMAVAATDLTDARAKWNSIEESTYGAGITLAAPGVSVYAPVQGNAYTAAFAGTSAAAPLVTGTAALLFGVNGNLNPASVKAYLVAGGDSISDQSISGRRLNAWQAVEHLLADYPVNSSQVAIEAKVDGKPWPTVGQGYLPYTVTCPFHNLAGNLVPAGSAYIPVGQCTISVGNFSPPNTVLTAISPCVGPLPALGGTCTSSLSVGQPITFTLQFLSVLPTAGFTMSSGGQTVNENGTLTISTPSVATVNFDGSRSATVKGATIAAWKWSIDGSVVSSLSGFQRTLSGGSTIQ